MLTERFIAAIGVPEKAPGTNVAKDAGVFLHEFQPLAQQRTVFKKSNTPPNCLAVTECHIFAAQADKAVVHVYNREKGNQEATVPFSDRITCIALACHDTVLALGTSEGRIFLWETLSGRQVTTAQAHLQKITATAVDPSSNFLLSASADSTVSVWSLSALLSFANFGSQTLSPLRTFSAHGAAVTAIAVGHSTGFGNFAVSAARDRTCLIWDYHSGSVLRTYLLAFHPLCATLDPADRAVYLGNEDGSVQQIDIYHQHQGPLDALGGDNESTAPFQPPPSSTWKQSDTSSGAVLSISLSFDGTTLLTGCQSGAILEWDVATGKVRKTVMQSALPGPVTNLSFLPVTGFEQERSRSFGACGIVKPKFGAFDATDAVGTVPGNYAVQARLRPNGLQSKSSADSDFGHALKHPSLQQSLLHKSLSDLISWTRAQESSRNAAVVGGEEDYMTLDDHPTEPIGPSLEEVNMRLKSQLAALRRLQAASFEKMEKLNAEKHALVLRERQRLAKTVVSSVNGSNRVAADDGEYTDDD